MTDDLYDVIDNQFAMPENEGLDRIMPLREAVERFIRPGMAIHTGVIHYFPYAAIYEIIRQFWGKYPAFTLISLGTRIHGAAMIRGCMVKKIVSTFNGDVYPSPGPNPIFNRAYLSGEVEFENWSVLTFPQRLRAAAQGLSCVTTRSLTGSGMQHDNKESFRVIEDPFREGAKIGLIAAMKPDISIYHAAAADASGNALFAAPFAEGIWGAIASHEGVVITTERLVPTEFIRRHSHLMVLPSKYVRSVSVVPMGAHPGGMYGDRIDGGESYAEDYEFAEDFRNATRDDAALDEWIRHWILDREDHGDYLRALGRDRIFYLKGKTAGDAWRRDIESKVPKIKPADECNETEWMIVVAARMLKGRILDKGYRSILAGIGMSNLAAWMACYDLKKEGYEIELVAETGFYGYLPRPADPFIFNHYNIPTCKFTTDVFMALGSLATGANNLCIGALGAAQVDKFGNINSTLIPGKAYITGSGGANDVLAGAEESILVVPQGRGRQVDEVPYISGCGERATILVTTQGIFEKPSGEYAFILTGCLAMPGADEQSCVDEISRNCGWKIERSAFLRMEGPPSPEELKMLRLFDPDRNFIGEL